MIRWYDKQGNPLTDMHDIESKLSDTAYKVVARTDLWWGGWVSTVWIGLDYSFIEGGNILIFETMVFKNKDSYTELDMDRYSTEKEALEGHKHMVSQWENPQSHPEISKYALSNSKNQHDEEKT